MKEIIIEYRYGHEKRESRVELKPGSDLEASELIKTLEETPGVTGIEVHVEIDLPE